MIAIDKLKLNNCDCIISIGGGSAIDTAKAIKLFFALDKSKDYFTQEHKYVNLKHITVPTTAGTGSESTRYAVIYKDGIKKSLTNDCLIPEYVILDDTYLKSLPYNQKVATIFDALCQSIESLWSINANDISVAYAKKSIEIIMDNIDNYLNYGLNCKEILEAAKNSHRKIVVMGKKLQSVINMAIEENYITMFQEISEIT